MRNLIKKLSSRLPLKYQQELKRLHFAHQIKKGTFTGDEAEYDMLEQWLDSGDWVLDIGANIGHYTKKLSRIVGNTGRVIAFEPVPETFELLAANNAKFPDKNVTLLNVAASDSTRTFGIHIPKLETGLDNYYMAKLRNDESNFQILSLDVDSLSFPKTIKLVKIDAEGHELHALQGMEQLLLKDHPLLIIEDSSPDIVEYLVGLGYSDKKLEGSPNRIFTHNH